MSSAKTISTVGLAIFALSRFASAEDAAESVIRQASTHDVGSAKVTISYPKTNADSPTGLDELPVGRTWGATSGESTSSDFEKDVRINGNWLPAGTYAVQLYRAAEDDLQFVFGEAAKGNGRPGVLDREVLRLAVTPAETPDVGGLRFGVENVEEDKRKRFTTADFYLQWGRRKATLRLETRGVRRRSTPPPPMPENVQSPWAVVMSSLEGYVAEDVEKHVAAFADDFETTFSDGGGTDAHRQTVNNSKRRGRLEGMLLDLEGLEWDVDEGTAEFRNIVVHSPLLGRSMSYSLELRDGRWTVTHLGATSLIAE